MGTCLDVHMASQGASGPDFYSLYFLPQDANVLRTEANPPVCASTIEGFSGSEHAL